MKNLKELIKRFPLLIAALLVGLIGIYKDYSSLDESNISMHELENIGNMNSDKGFSNEKNVAKAVDSDKIDSDKIDSDKIDSDKIDNNKFDIKNIFSEKIQGDRIDIVNVHDGDSIRIRIDNSKPFNVRFYGIDAPELKQKYGEESKDFLYKLLKNNKIDSLEFINIDKYNRPIVILNLADGISIQQMLLGNGMAWYYGYFCNIEPLCTEWKYLEKNAQKQYLGLWANGSAKAPWEWKRKK